MKKKATLLVTIVALLTIAVIGGTLAWFTSSDEVINTINTGTIKIDLVEENFTNNQINIMPGTVITKDPVINNVGSNAAWVRYKVTATVLDGSTVTALSAADLKYLKLNSEGQYVASPIATTDWSAATKLDVNGKLSIFDKVEIPTAWGNQYQGKTLQIVVDVQAIQYDNNVKADGSIIENNSWLSAE